MRLILLFLGRVNVNVLTFPSCRVFAIRLLARDKLAILGIAVNYASCVSCFVRHVAISYSVGFSPTGLYGERRSSQPWCGYTLAGMGLPAYPDTGHRNPLKKSCTGRTQRGRMWVSFASTSQPIGPSEPLAPQLAVQYIWNIFLLFASRCKCFLYLGVATIRGRVKLGQYQHRLFAFGRFEHDSEGILACV